MPSYEQLVENCPCNACYSSSSGIVVSFLVENKTNYVSHLLLYLMDYFSLGYRKKSESLFLLFFYDQVFIFLLTSQ
jgi:hypothetical protein